MIAGTTSGICPFGIDGAGALQAPAGLLRLSGWLACEKNNQVGIRLRLASGNLFDCIMGEARPDVAGIYPELPDAAQSGFRLETHIPAGLQIGTLEYFSRKNSDWVPFHTFSIIAGLSGLVAEIESSPPSAGGAKWGIQGWCFHPQYEIETLSVKFAHNQAVLHHGTSRPDVAAHYPHFHSALDSGISGHLLLGPGVSPVMLTARLRNGSIVRQQVISELNVPNPVVERTTRAAREIRASQIKLPAQDRPEVSIIIPIYNQLDLTLGCLESLVRHVGWLTFEVIIIDDCSAPEVARILSNIPNLRLISNQTNQGFVLNCNRGAAEARGEYLVFLNNDTEVGPGWLEALHKVFSERPLAGLVGAKLIYPDGSLQEAGGIVWEDGTGHNFGRGDDASRPEYNYLRKTDYCTGACLMIPRTLFAEAGGFDTLYCPAYYEDTDLAFSIRAVGREVYYQPDAVVKHFEGASSGNDTRSGPKRHQVINQERFAKKWARSLAGFGTDRSASNLARDRHTTGRILVIDACALTPDMDAGSVRMFNLLTILAREGCKVTFVAENLQFHEPYSSLLRREGVEHLGSPATYDLNAYLETNAFAFDVIILSRKHVAQRFVKLLRRCAPQTKIIFDTVDLMFLRFFRQADVEKSEKIRQEAEISKKVELEICAEVDLVYVVSPEEANILQQEMPSEKIAVVPLIHDVAATGPHFNERLGILFVGGFQHPPNLDAIEFFLDEILPLLTRQLPSLPVHIVGSNMPERLKIRASSQIVVHGYVPSMNRLLDQVRLSIAPLRFGAGVKGKVNQSMAHGVPVVATSMATEGMHLIDGVNVMVGDTPEEFANALYRIYTDEDLWTRISAAGMENIAQHFSFPAVRRKLMDSLLGQVPGLLTPRQDLPRREAAICRLNEVVHFGRLNTAEPFLDGGWSSPGEEFRWATDRKARLRLRFEPAQTPRNLRVILFPLLVPGTVERQRVQIKIPAGILPDTLEMSKAGEHEFVVELPTTPLPSEIFSMEFSFPDAVVPRELGISGDMRRLSVAFVQLSFF